jgi:hypothetical protein
MTTTTFNNFDTIFDHYTNLLEELAYDPSWDGSRFEVWRKTAKTNLGNAGEALVKDVIIHMFELFYGSDAEIECVVKSSGRGDYDVYLVVNGTYYYFEVKTATQGSYDKKKNKARTNYQFNSIKKMCDYDFVFCLGVAPNNMYFKVETKQWVIDTLTTRMSKNVDGAYKHSTTVDSLIELTPENLNEVFIGHGIIDKQD